MEPLANAKAPVAATTGAFRKVHSKSPQCNAARKSAATGAQRDRILEALRRRPQTTVDLRQLGIFQAPARIKELRDEFGYVIETSRVVLVDADGYTHHGAALYSLVSEPEGSTP